VPSETATILSPLEILTADRNVVEVMPIAVSAIKSASALPLFTGLTAAGGYGSMDFFYYIGTGFSIWFSNYEMVSKTNFTSRGNFPVLELSIPFKKQFNSDWEGKIWNGSREKQLQMAWLPHINSRAVFAEGGNYSTFDVHYTKEYLQRFAGQFPQLDIFLEKVERKEPCVLNANASMLSPAMVAIINDILHCDLPAAIAKYLYESSVLMLLLRVLDSTRADGQLKNKFSSYDIDCVREAKSLISEDPSTKYSIYELSQLIGLNENKLQRCFKSEYGTTIFDYGQAVRLDYAKRLLLDTTESIQSIAIQCGYPDHTNLTAAFKKRFGYTPLYFRGAGK
jgi:AraC-like DNA-binding protein